MKSFVLCSLFLTCVVALCKATDEVVELSIVTGKSGAEVQNTGCDSPCDWKTVTVVFFSDNEKGDALTLESGTSITGTLGDGDTFTGNFKVDSHIVENLKGVEIRNPSTNG